MQITSNSHQIKDLVETSEKILLLTHTQASADEIGCLLAFYWGLKNLGKEVTAAYLSLDGLPPNTKFLPGAEEIVSDLGPKNLVVSIDYGKEQIEKVSYNTEGGKLNLVITPRDKSFDIENIQYGFSGLEADLIFVFGARNLTLLGSVYEDFKDELEKTPLVNLDYQESNSQFGSINVIDFSKSSLAEVVYPLFGELNIGIDEKIATCLLASIFWATSNFRSPDVNSEAFLLAFNLLKQKADIKKLITGLYQSHSLPELRLWSRIMGEAQLHEDLKILVLQASKKDFGEAEARSDIGEDLVQSPLFLLQDVDSLIFFQELEGSKIKISFYSINKETILKEFVKNQGGQVRKGGGYLLREGDLATIRSEMVRSLKQFLTQPLDIEEAKKEVSHQVQEAVSQIDKQEDLPFIEPPKIYSGSS